MCARKEGMPGRRDACVFNFHHGHNGYNPRPARDSRSIRLELFLASYYVLQSGLFLFCRSLAFAPTTIMGSGPLYTEPLIDIRNPCYSPAETASTFLSNVASESSGPPRSRDQYLISFLARLLYPPGASQDGFFCWPLKNLDASFADDLLSHSQSSATTSSSSDGVVRHLPVHSTRASPSTEIPAKRSASLLNNNGDTGARHSSLAVGLGLGQRTYASISDESFTYSDLQAPSKHKPSSPSINMSSFIVLKADPIADFGSPAHTTDGSATYTPQVVNLAQDFDANAMLGRILQHPEGKRD